MLTTIYDANSKNITIYNKELFDKFSYISCVRNFEKLCYIKCVNYDMLSEEDKLKCFNVMRIHNSENFHTMKIKQREPKSESDHYISQIGFPDYHGNGEWKKYLFADFDSTKDKFIRILG